MLLSALLYRSSEKFVFFSYFFFELEAVRPLNATPTSMTSTPHSEPFMSE